MMDNNCKKSQEMERTSDLHGMPTGQTSSSGLSNIDQENDYSTIAIRRLSKQQQQHLHLSRATFPDHGSTGGSYFPIFGTNVSTSGLSTKQQPHDSQMGQVPVHQRVGENQLGTLTEATGIFSKPWQNSLSEARTIQCGNLPQLTNNSNLPHNSVHCQSSSSKEQKFSALSSMARVKQDSFNQETEQQHKSQLSSFPPVQFENGNAIKGTLEDEGLKMTSPRAGFSTSLSAPPSNPVPSMTAPLEPCIMLNSRIPSTTSSVGIESIAKTLPKKPSSRRKKPLESLGSSPPLPRSYNLVSKTVGG